MSRLPNCGSVQIRDVWAYNLEEEFEFIRNIVDDYPYVAMDTEFPGIVFQTSKEEHINHTEFEYKKLKLNVDSLKLIQLGLTFSDDKGNLPRRDPDNFCVWQFNFREFNPYQDIFVEKSINLLRQSRIDFARNNCMGISVGRFSELLMSSGVVLNNDIYWVTFHSGYDFGFLVKLLTGRELPETHAKFFELIAIYFPVLYDLKHLMTYCFWHGGLKKLAEQLGVERVGISHQAGSDSLLTARVFKKVKESYFGGSVARWSGVLYGFEKQKMRP